MGITRGQWKLAPLKVEIGEEAAIEQPRRAPGIFVTGTGTEIGKTIVAAALARSIADHGQSVAVFKPALTGMDEFPEYDEAAAKARRVDRRPARPRDPAGRGALVPERR